jgi:Trypsin
MKNVLRTAVAAAALVSMTVAGAQSLQRTASGVTANGMQWQAQSMLTGVTSTLAGGPITNGGDPIYWPSYPRDSGVVHLLMDYGPGVGAFICSGTLLADRQSILTAGHCVSGGAGTANPLTTTVFFQPAGGVSPGTRIQSNGLPNGGAETRTVTNYFVNAGYTGEVIDHNDVAVLRLNAPAPAQAQGYGLYTTNDLEGQNFTVHGYGVLGDGATGTTNFAARLRNGDNRYDFMLGNALFGQNWAAALEEPFSQIQYSIVSDFDNGLAANDTGCRVATDGDFAGAAGAVFCNLGVGAREVGVAGGDSGGPSFINGMITSVNSYGLTFGPAFGDVGPECLPAPAPSCLNSSFGEFSGYVPVWLHADFINASMVPETSTYLMMALGLVGVGAMARRRRQVA